MVQANLLKQGVIQELEFLQSMGEKIFLYPFVDTTKLKRIGYAVTHILVLCTAFQLTLTLLSNGTDWLEIINVAPNLGVVLMTTIKYMKIYNNKQFYHKIFNHFGNGMWSIVEIRSLEQQKIIKAYKWKSMFINRFLLYYSIPLIFIVNSFPYLVMKYESRVNGFKEYLYPFDGWYPFDKVKWYAVAYIWESCMTAIVVCVFGFSNMINASFIIFICMELKIIGNRMENLIIDESADAIFGDDNEEIIHCKVRADLKMLIAKHTFLTKTSAKLDAVLGDAMLLNYSLGAIFICLTAFTCTVVDNLYKSIRYFFMFTGLLVEIFNQCLIGQILSDHSVNLTESIYYSNWSCATPDVKKMMLMLMVRTQKPFELTARGYLPMNMNTFSRICSTSYQCFNLLRTIYSQ